MVYMREGLREGVERLFRRSRPRPGNRSGCVSGCFAVIRTDYVARRRINRCERLALMRTFLRCVSYLFEKMTHDVTRVLEMFGKKRKMT